jgi:hypothetical protein
MVAMPWKLTPGHLRDAAESVMLPKLLFDPDRREISARVWSVVNVQKESGSLSSCRKMAREKRTTGNAFRKSLLRKDTTARLSF